jgi:hypothetical protein
MLLVAALVAAPIDYAFSGRCGYEAAFSYSSTTGRGSQPVPFPSAMSFAGQGGLCV